MSWTGGPRGMPAPIAIDAEGGARVSASDPVLAAWDALGCVYDPELCLDVVSLGLVYDIRQEDGRLEVDMTLTMPGCPASESLPHMARAAIADEIGGALDVDVKIVWDPPWSPAMMSDDAAAALGFRAR